MKTYDIHKAAGILIKNRKLLVERSYGKDVFVGPGGKIENNETTKQALIRELLEEVSVKVKETSLQKFGEFYAPASGQEHKILRMEVFIVDSWTGDPKPDNEVEEIAWVDSNTKLKLSSVFEHEIIPRLKAQNLIN